MKRNLILFFDCGDTIIDEATQVRDARGIVTEAVPIQGMDSAVKALHDNGFRMALVADGETESFANILRLTGLEDCFEERVISEEVGVQKPAQIMFETAVRRMGLSEADRSNILMIGNNLKKDIAGANRADIASVWMDWSPRYFHSFEEPDWEPDFTVNSADELVRLVWQLEKWVVTRLLRANQK
ncbi:MAG: HAD-IA family hydrolase [Lachnospiraceae bacterium]|nr:HAD-IA family hydrolase [Lachnospiraceae bacterium]